MNTDLNQLLSFNDDKLHRPISREGHLQKHQDNKSFALTQLNYLAKANLKIVRRF
jgi:hypothetical protein